MRYLRHADRISKQENSESQKQETETDKRGSIREYKDLPHSRTIKHVESVRSAEPPESADENYEASLEAVELKIHELENAAVLNDAEETKKVAEELRQAFAQVFAKYGVVIA